MQRSVGDQPHRDRAGVPATRDQPAEAPLQRGLGIGVEPLRIVLTREREDLFLVDDTRAGHDDLAGMELGELHAVSESAERTRSRSARKVGCSGCVLVSRLKSAFE